VRLPSICLIDWGLSDQAAAYKVLRSGAKHVVLADHAGSGKTLAYLLPLLEALRAEERAAGGPVTCPRSPRVVVVTPTSGARVAGAVLARALDPSS
jgi:ATP-dependent RNA helicase DDX18/HAS1